MKKLEHILCIDDEEDILEVAKMCLEIAGGFTVSTLNSGAEALKQVEKIKPDLILLDVMMPIMDGPSTLKNLKKIHALIATPIVFMTARVQPTEIQQYLDLGANAVVPKPFDPMTLSPLINEIWEKFHV
ncbi:MAG: response regulator [Pseudomonadota bacterium]